MNRREFIKTTTVVTVGTISMRTFEVQAREEKKIGLVDTNVSLGRWPFARLPFDDTSGLVKKLRGQGVKQAWVGSFGALFSRDLAAVNAEIVVECRKHGRGMLLPFGTVNPMQAGWEEELRRCAEEHRMRGLRLFPTYHGYKLNDPVFVELLTLAAKQRLVVQIVAAMEDERTQPPLAKVPNLDAAPLVDGLKKVPGARVMLLNWHRCVKPDLAKRLAAMGVCFDIANVENVGGVGILMKQISAQRVVFGSHAPFFYFEAAQFKLTESVLDADVEAAVRAENARRLLSV